MEPLSSFVGHDSDFDHGVMDSKYDVDSQGPLWIGSLICSNSLVTMHDKSRGEIVCSQCTTS